MLPFFKLNIRICQTLTQSWECVCIHQACLNTDICVNGAHTKQSQIEEVKRDSEGQKEFKEGKCVLTLHHIMWGERLSLVPQILLALVLSSNHNLHLVLHVTSMAETSDVCLHI